MFLTDLNFIIGASILALITAGFLFWKVLLQSDGGGKMREVSRAIQQGARAYLNRQYQTVALFAFVIAVILWLTLGQITAWGFLVGAFFSGLAGYIGMNVAVRANVRTTQAVSVSLAAGFKTAFRGGAVTGMMVVGLGLLAVAVFYSLTKDPLAIIGVGFGGSLVSLFARVGGGIYTKAADVGADLVGKIEAKIPEDDPRNPAVIADNVGDNVGDNAGMAADLFETYTVTIIGAMLIGALLGSGEKLVLLPLVLGALGILASIIGTFFVRLGKKENIIGALYAGLAAAGLLGALGFWWAIKTLMGDLNLFYASLVGLFIVLGLFGLTEYYTGLRHRPVKAIAKSSQTGPATNIMTGLAFGLESTFLPVILISAGILVSFMLAGVYGVAIAAVAMLSLTGMIISLDAFGPITDNAGGIAEMAGLSEKTRQRTDALDAVGNTTKAVTKAYAIGSAVLAALTLFAAYVQELIAKSQGAQEIVFLLNDPRVLVGLLVGGSIPFLFSAFTIQAVGRVAFSVVEEVREQFKLHPGILKGTQKPDYGRTVDLVTRGGLRAMVAPGLLAVIAPLAVGFLLGPLALGGLLLGSIITGVFVALQMTSGGAAWDNAKKSIEAGKYGGKGSEAHMASVIGDTVGDPYKDTAGPAINPLIKVMNTIAILIASGVLTYSLQLF
jgi:K(+)-stimulated pyrophosphate-energized sodium pump